jgi:hypothetical protein
MVSAHSDPGNTNTLLDSVPIPHVKAFLAPAPELKPELVVTSVFTSHTGITLLPSHTLQFHLYL